MNKKPSIAEGPCEAGVPVEILAAVKRLYYTDVVDNSSTVVLADEYTSAAVVRLSRRLFTGRNSPTLHHPTFQGCFVIDRLGHLMINVLTKLEVPSSKCSKMLHKCSTDCT